MAEIENVFGEREKERIKCRFCQLKAQRWKIQEHEEELCALREVPCINSIYGKVEPAIQNVGFLIYFYFVFQR